MAQNARLVERGHEKDQQLALLSDKMRSIELTLERVQEMEGRVRLLTGMPESESPLITEKGPQTPRLGEGASQSDIARVYESARDLMDRMEGRRLALKKVARYFFSQRSEIMQIPNKWPLRGWVTSLFGIRNSPFTGKPAMHNGMDIAAPEGAVIRAPAAGQVIYEGEQGGYGNVLVLQHGRGITTLYGHLAKSLVSEGAYVPSNAPIALVGNTGRSTGPHLHYEVRLNNIPINPKRFLPAEEGAEEEEAMPAITQPVTPTPMPAWPSEAIPAEPVAPASPIPPTTQIEEQPL
jgi:murein DD-endopeptidase MepM/ murein hydrolase activator NlpD